jgi:maleylpyruvate isomerase
MDETARDIAGAEGAHARLLALLRDRAGALDGGAPSRLPDWTVGHVLTHLARNADSIVRVLTAEPDRDGAVERYDGGGPGRDREIEAGAARPSSELVGDVVDSTARLEAAWSPPADWARRSRETRGVLIPATDLPLLRWREVEVHMVDLGLGVEPSDWPSDFVGLQLRAMEMRWNARRPMGLTGLPPEALAADPPMRLAWLYGRVDLPGLPPAGVF